MEEEEALSSSAAGDLWTLILATAASYPLGLFIGQPWLLPLLNAAPVYTMMIGRLARAERREAVRALLVWALTLVVFGTLTFTLWPALARAGVVHGPEYRDEMFRWIRSGEGREGQAVLFLSQHVLHLVAFVILGLATASAGSLLMGAVLVNAVDFYVSALATAGAPAWAVALLGWQPWALCRVAALCALSVVLAEPLLFQVLRRPRPEGATPYLRWAVVGILADAVLRALLAPSWRVWLRGLLP